MKASISIGSAYYDGEGWDGLVEFVEAADRLAERLERARVPKPP